MSTQNNSKKITESDKEAMKRLAPSNPYVLTKNETVRLCVKLGFYDKATGVRLLNGEVPGLDLSVDEEPEQEGAV